MRLKKIKLRYKRFKTPVDTQFCTHDLIKENDLNDHPCFNLFLYYMHQFISALHALIHSLHIIKMILRF